MKFHANSSAAHFTCLVVVRLVAALSSHVGAHRADANSERRCGCRPGNSAFTLVELLVVLMVFGLLGVILTPVLAKAKPNSKAAQCQNNLRQLTAAWSVYAGDFNDRVANNFGVSEIIETIVQGTLANWVNNVMTWGASASTEDCSNTNIFWATHGGLGPYLRGATSPYQCPADNYLSPVQKAAGWSARLRSVSMNSVFGRFSSGPDPTANGLNWAFTQYAQYLKQTSVPKPMKTWLLIDEHPDSINDGYFVNSPLQPMWQDIPASYHNGGCSVSFSDGHTELKRWQSLTSWYPVQFSFPAQKTFDSLGLADFAWYLSRTGYIDAKTREPAFGY